MASEIKSDKLSPSTGTALQIGDASDTITIPTGATFTVTDGIGVAAGGTGLSSFTAGDVLYATGTTTLAKLAKGTAEQVLAMNSGATAPDWGSVDLTVLPTITVAKGGTNLTSFTAGDVLYATGSTTLAKLAKGAAAEVLTMNTGATAPEWAAAGGGAWNLLTTETASSDDEINFVDGVSGVDLTTYKMYKVTGIDLDTADNDTNPMILWSDDGGVSYETSSYATSMVYLNYSGSPSGTGSTSETLFLNNIGNSAGECGHFEFTFPNPSSSLHKLSWWQGVVQPATGDMRCMFGGSTWTSTAAVDAFQFKMSSGAFSGVLKLYGIS